MYKGIKELFYFLSKKQRIFFLKVQILVCIQSFLEVISVVILMPYMNLVGNLNLIKSNYYFSLLYSFFDFDNEYNFMIFLSILISIFFLISTYISIFTLKKVTFLGVSLGMDMAKQLYKYYLGQSWLFHTKNNTSTILNKVSIETSRITSSIMLPFIVAVSKLVLILFMYIALLIVNPKLTLFSTVIICLLYYFLFKIVEKKLHKHGQNLSSQQENRFKSVNEGLGGIKQIILFNNQSDYIGIFDESSNQYSKSFTKIQVLTTAPKFILELVAVILVIFFILYTLIVDQKNSLDLLPVLSVYGLAGYKMLPAFQSVYFLLASVKGNFSAFENIKKDFYDSLEVEKKNYNFQEKLLDFKNRIEFKNVCFDYDYTRKVTISDFNMIFEVKKKIGIVGPSGAGKSTLVDLFLGLLTPTKGQIIVDGTELNNFNMKSWQKKVSYVPQDTYLIDDTIQKNITFGSKFNKADKSDKEKLKTILTKVELNDFINSLPSGIDTAIGERGVQLSGGQKQRIAIARALYQDREVLVLDEATSSLDMIVEKEIMKNINDSFNEKTILIIAHRLSTIENCDYIYFIENGRILDVGTYKELVVKNDHFRKMTGRFL
jgi:ABC-type multidrug transport system fused ATPase/permease subunit